VVAFSLHAGTTRIRVRSFYVVSQVACGQFTIGTGD
jgi:hypothetical protein